MKIMKKIGVFALVVILLFSVMSVSVFAAGEPQNGSSAAQEGKLDMGLKPESFEERLEYALQGTATGMIMVFAVLGLLCLILYGSKFVFYDIPNKKREKAIKVKQESLANAPQPAVEVTQSVSETVAPAPVAQDDGELAAVITAAIAAMLESEEYKNEFMGGFRVVSFKRSTQGAWNRK